MRYTRHELKHDKFAESAAGAVHWTVDHRRNLTNAGIALAVIVLLVLGFLWFHNYRSDKAAKEFSAAMVTYNAPIVPAGTAPDPNMITFASEPERTNAAKKAFYDVSSKYGSTRSGKYSRYFAALCEQDLGNSKAAEEQLKAVADGREDDIANLARFALASVYRSENRAADAINIYKQIIDKPTLTVPKATAQLELADIYAATQPADAKKILNEVAKDNAKNAAGEIAQQKLATMK